MLLAVVILFSLSSFGQNKSNENLLYSETLKEKSNTKYIYELPKKLDYKVFNPKGKLVLDGKGKFINFTKYKDGVYYIKYEGQVIKFLKNDLYNSH